MNGERKHLLIPIHIDALAVPKGGGGFKKVNAAPQYSKLEKEYFIAADLRRPLEDLDLETGIHLHFRLPAAAAYWDQKREQGFPRIPNRWLVQRYYKPKSGGLRMKAWLIRGDEEAPAGASAVVLPVFRAKKRGTEDETLLDLWRTGEANWASGKEYDTPLELRRTGVKEVIWDGDKRESDYEYSADNKNAKVELTAVTGGDAGFSAHYPACRSILGLHDDLEGVPKETELSYLVTGWYSGKEDDPWDALVARVAEAADKRSNLAATMATADEAKKKEIEKESGELKKASEILDEWMKDRGCAEDFGKIDELGGAELAKKLPAGILCHGRVTNVVLQGKSSHAITRQRGPFEDFARADQYWVDIGNSSAEAFAARVAAQLRTSARGKSVKDQQALLEDLITAFQTGQLSEGTDYSAVDAELHRQGFASAGGGGIWVIEPEAQAGSPKALGPEGARRTPARLPQVLQEKLDELNRCQREYERYARWFRDYQWELYAVWHRCMDAIYEEGSVEDQVKEALETSKESLEYFLGGYWGSKASKTQASLTKSNRMDARDALIKALKDYNGQPETTTKYVLPNPQGSSLPDAPQQPAAPFYTPNDPVLLVSGPAMRAINTEPRKKGALRCRLTGEELQSFIYDEADGRKGLLKEATKLVEDLGLTNYLKAIPPWCQSLLKEALLQDDIAEKLVRPTEYTRTEVKPECGVLPDDYGTFQWEDNPWIPVYVYWEVEWRNEFTKDVIRNRWTLDPGAGQELPADANLLDLRRNTDLLPGGSVDENWPGGLPVIRGLSFPGLPLIGLQEQEEMFKGKAKDLLTQINMKMENHLSRMMSVALGGFHEALVMRRAGDQLPPLDYARWKKENQNEEVPRFPFFLDEISKALGPDFHPDSSPAGYLSRMERGPFCPVRAGSLKVERLRVIDAFGQRIDVPLEEMGTEGFAHSGRLGSCVVPGPPPAFQLQPRFCRPLRLELNGIPAGTQVAGAPPSTPVCGWVVLNRFDQNLVLYAANGRPASILQKFYKPEDLEITDRLFSKVPVPRSSADGTAEDTIQNEHLKAFEDFVLHSLNLDEGLAFDKLLNQAVESTGQRAPEENPAVSVLIGRPLALVRAEIRFETDGLPALDQEKSWIAPPVSRQDVNKILNPSLPTDAPPWPDGSMVTGNVEGVRCPIRLGDRRSPSDGLVGFFIGEPGSSPFYASRGFVFSKDTEKLSSLQNLLLDGRQSLKVTLLMDPQARVHATSGVLPRVFFQLPAAELAAARQVREVFFQTAPVLGTPATPQVPKLSDDYGQWSWAYRPDVTAWKDNPDLDSTSDRADFSMGWPTLTEGWLKLKIEPVRVRGFWMSVPAEKPGKGDTVTLAWSVQGADSIQLFRLKPDGTVAKKEGDFPAHKKDWPVTIEQETTFELRASDEAGYEDKKEITIQVKG